jgi:hypothetical protein
VSGRTRLPGLVRRLGTRPGIAHKPALKNGDDSMARKDEATNYHKEKYSIEDIAKKMEISISSVKQYLFLQVG